MPKARSCRGLGHAEGLGLGHAEGLVMPSAAKHSACRAIQDSCHPEHSEGSAQRSIRAAVPSGILVILSAAKDLRSEAFGRPGRRGSWACVARRILRVAQDDTGRRLVMPKARSCRRPGHAEGPVMPSAAKHPGCRAIRDSCHPERSEGSAQRGVWLAGPPRQLGVRRAPDPSRCSG